MNIPKELVEQWCGEAYANNIGIQYIAQRAAEWALSQPVSMEPLTQAAVVEAFCKLKHETQYVSVFDAGVRFAEKHYATQLAVARQQGAEEERKNANVWVAGIAAKRIAELEQKNAQLLEALQELVDEFDWHDTKTDKARAAIQAAEVKP